MLDGKYLWRERIGKLRLCLVRVKAFPKNILFSGKENVFMCLAATKFVLRKIKFQCLVHSNIFTENALHAQFSTHFLNCKHADNESIPHSFTEETKPSKKIHQIWLN